MSKTRMAKPLETNFAGIQSPNPFWLASAPPTNTGYQVANAFRAGWGGAVWKTLGQPIVNVSSRYSAVSYKNNRMMGLNNIELITDRPLDVNLAEMKAVKAEFPHHALIASLMFETETEWHDCIRRCEDIGVDGFELNFGCPHGMCERGMGSAVGQNPDVAEKITGWAKAVATKPVIVKLTPNITDIRVAGLAAQRGGADAVSLINTINSVTGINLDTWQPNPSVNGYSTHGGYCGPAVKPIALNMVAELAKDPDFNLPISGIGGIETWQDAAEFFLMGASSVQVCTAVMHYGFRIVEEMTSGLESYLAEHRLTHYSDLTGQAVQRFTQWQNLDLNHKVIAHIDPDTCIGCQVCYSACEDGAHQSIALLPNSRVPQIKEESCVGCNLCSLVCPVDDCITMVPVERGLDKVTWLDHPANPHRRALV